MIRILFVINPVSGNTGKEDFRKQASDFFDKKLYSPNFYETSGDNDQIFLLKKILKDKPDIVVTVGGDGTVNLVARVVMNKDIKMGIVPLGSANGMAAELSIPSKLPEAFEIIAGGNILVSDIIRINKKLYSLHLCDIGFNARIIKKFDKQRSRGFVTYAKLFFHEILKPVIFHFVIHEGRKKIQRKALMLVIANARRYGTGALINPNGKLNDGLVEIVLIKTRRFLHYLQMVVPFFTGKIHQLNYIEVFNAAEFIIENPDRGNIQVDGEVAGNAEKIHIETIPGVINMLVP
jgi:YegS/Rv2252/BmrU family lipid kinase